MRFPITEEAFLDCQEAFAGRQLDTDEREVMLAILTLINKAYLKGKQGDKAALDKMLSLWAQCDVETWEGGQRLFDNTPNWMTLAWKIGNETKRKEENMSCKYESDQRPMCRNPAMAKSELCRNQSTEQSAQPGLLPGKRLCAIGGRA